MIFFNMSQQVSAKRRQLLEGAAVGLGIALLPMAGRAQAQAQAPLQGADPAEVKAIVDAFLNGAQPSTQGITLDMPVLGDNPASVPIKVKVDLPITPESYCEEIIILAEGNPRPLACRFEFTPLIGSAEVAIRLRLIETQAIQALARMSDGRVLVARRHIAVTAGGCGM